MLPLLNNRHREGGVPPVRFRRHGGTRRSAADNHQILGHKIGTSRKCTLPFRPAPFCESYAQRNVNSSPISLFRGKEASPPPGDGA